MEKQQLFDNIERYLAGELPPDEQVKFEVALKDDPKLKKEVALHKDLARSLGGQGFHDFRKKVQAADQQFGKKEATVRTLPVMRWVMAAAAAVLFGFIVWLLVPAQSDTNLFAANFEPYPMVLSTRSEINTEDQGMLQKALDAYRQENFNEAQQLFGILHENHPDLSLYAFYEAVSALAVKDAQNAKATFENILKNGPENLKEQARWYLALSHIQLANNQAARAILSEIQSGQFQYEEAQSLLENLD